MAIITLTTDFGANDYYVAAFKGEIMSACPSVQLIDLSNTIPPYEIKHAAYVLKNAYTHFPKGTIHIARVFETGVSGLNIIVCSYNDHYFIAPDNGLLSMVFSKTPSAAVIIDATRIKIKTPHDLYCKAIKTLIYNGSLTDLGMPVNNIERKIMLRPVIQENGIRGIIMHIDYYGNAITNINRTEFQQAIKDRSFTLWLRRNDSISRLVEFYSDVPQGEQLARFNSKDMLEISVNCGRANELLGLHEGDNIKIEY
ncbi:MAG: SAM-dependent chlorinase/fluorinase [Bacteroidetes bacterium]|nr:SAM-dependent chlorinase/fluorinase [Bacteroidota bacterium]